MLSREKRYTSAFQRAVQPEKKWTSSDHGSGKRHFPIWLLGRLTQLVLTELPECPYSANTIELVCSCSYAHKV